MENQTRVKKTNIYLSKFRNPKYIQHRMNVALYTDKRLLIKNKIGIDVLPLFLLNALDHFLFI